MAGISLIVFMGEVANVEGFGALNQGAWVSVQIFIYAGCPWLQLSVSFLY
ncbi:MAG: hypothetical protein KIG95_14805 [Comamonas sp.]|nr:hypothetical protein [Comamonas sp.]